MVNLEDNRSLSSNLILTERNSHLKYGKINPLKLMKWIKNTNKLQILEKALQNLKPHHIFLNNQCLTILYEIQILLNCKDLWRKCERKRIDLSKRSFQTRTLEMNPSKPENQNFKIRSSIDSGITVSRMSNHDPMRLTGEFSVPISGWESE